MDFTRRVDVDLPYEEAIEQIKEALRGEGFGVLTEIDIRQTLKAKLDVDVPPQVIIGACNPQLANWALAIDPRIATLLPCNVVVREEGDHVVVEALDPKLIAEVPANPDLAPIADEAGARIERALEKLPSRPAS
jgi:uncharacterized protein (DUF302 family)